MKFIADAMLGRLAKWMRAIGCDVVYSHNIEDGELVKRALREGRLILTRDTLLIKRRKAKGNFFFVDGDSYKDQLKQVTGQFSIDPYQNLLTRCIECNIPLEEVGKGQIMDAVPAYVYKTQDSFRICPGCRKIYWPATHRDGMLETLEQIFGRRGGSDLPKF